jgi:DNA-binding response OmpR family regulator
VIFVSPDLNFQVIPLSEVPLDKFIPATGKQQRIVLVVDDERVIADTLSVILSRSGFSVMTAYDGETALELAGVVTPDLLLSDVMMGPGIDGMQLAIQMVTSFPECKVLLFSGHAATVNLLTQARRSGYNFTLLTKPVHPADLLMRITESFCAEAMTPQNA